eukprot:1106875-Prymnesium_polylepis.1
MAPLSEALRCGMAGRYKQDRLAPMSAVGSCVCELPYPTAPPRRRHWRLGSVSSQGGNVGAIESASRQAAPQVGPAGVNASRPLLLHFAGSFDVCCHGRAIRCAQIARVLVSPLDATLCAPRVLQVRNRTHDGGAARRGECAAAPAAQHVLLGQVHAASDGAAEHAAHE